MTLPAGFPRPDAAQRAEAARRIAEVPAGTILLVDQLALGVLPEVARIEGRRLKLAMIVHHPLALEDLSDPAEAKHFRANEHEALRHSSVVIVPSRTTARILTTDYAVPADHIVVAAPGSDPQPVSPGRSDGPLALLSIGSVVPRKQHELLVEALAGIASAPWHLTIVGDVERHPAQIEKVRSRIARHGLSGRVTLTGGLDREALEPLWREAGLYVSSSRHEGYGMAIAEALSRGIPVVSTEAGAVGEWVDRRSALIVPVGDDAAMRSELARAMGDASVYRSLREGALAARKLLPTWRSTASIVSERLAALEPCV